MPEKLTAILPDGSEVVTLVFPSHRPTPSTHYPKAHVIAHGKKIPGVIVHNSTGEKLFYAINDETINLKTIL